MAEEISWGKAIGDGLDAYAQYSDPRYAQMRANARREKNEDEDRAFQREQRARQRKGWGKEDAAEAIGQATADFWLKKYGGGHGSAGTPTTPPSPGQPSVPPPPSAPDMGTPGVSQTFPVGGAPMPPPQDDSLASAAPPAGAPPMEPAAAGGPAAPAQPGPQAAAAPAGGPAGSPFGGRGADAADLLKHLQSTVPPEYRHLLLPTIANAKAAQDEAMPQALVMLSRGDTEGAKRVFNGSGKLKVDDIKPGSKPGTYKVTIGGQEHEIDPKSQLIALAKDPLMAQRQDEEHQRKGAESQARIGLYGAQTGTAQARARAADAAAGASNARAEATRTKMKAPQPELAPLKGPDIDRVHKEVEQAFANVGLAGRDAFGNVTYKTPEAPQMADRAKAIARRAFQEGRPLSGEAAVAIAKEGKPSRGVRIGPDGALVSSDGIKHQGRVYSIDGAQEQRATQADLVNYVLDIGIDKVDHPRFRQEVIPAAKKAGIFSGQESDDDIVKLVKEWVRTRSPDPGDPMDQRGKGIAAPPPAQEQQTAAAGISDIDPNGELEAEPDTEIPAPDEEDTLDAAGRGPLQFGPRLNFPPTQTRSIYGR